MPHICVRCGKPSIFEPTPEDQKRVLWAWKYCFDCFQIRKKERGDDYPVIEEQK